MHWESFYIKPNAIHGEEIDFPMDETRHLARVLRKKKGDVIWAVDGLGTAYEVEITAISNQAVKGRILNRRRRLGEPLAHVTLIQGVIKGDRFDWLVEKATEIGISRIIPMISRRSEVKVTPAKRARWKRIAVAALKQSGRTVLPEITSPKTFEQAIGLGAECKYRFIAHPDNAKPLNVETQSQKSKSLIIVGPEGGFTAEEIEQAVEQSFQSVSLGPRRLRAETAGITLSAILLSKLGELE